MYVEYRSNNSGGSWWLTDENWMAAGVGMAADARRDGLSLRDATNEWERVTGLYATNAGCSGCK